MKRNNTTPDKRFVDFAELLVEIMVESDTVLKSACLEAGKEMTDVNFGSLKIPEKIIHKTATAIQKDFEAGILKENNGMLYDEYSIDNYGGYIDKEIVKQVKRL